MKTNIIRLFALMALVLCFGASAANKLEGVRIWAAPESTRLVFDLTNKPSYQHAIMASPDRLVVDFANTQSKLALEKVANNSKLVKKLRFSKAPSKGMLRVVIDLRRPVSANLFSLPPTAPYGNRLVVDLEEKTAPSRNVTASAPKSLRDIVIAIDAGHGGDDPGSIGPTGLYEKKVAMEISKRVQSKIDATPGMKAVMTRSGDYFVNLNKRSDLARKQRADLLVSIHADAFTSPNPKGASVWVLSMRRANSEIGRWLEQKEKHSELLGGAGEIIQNADDEQYLAMTLLDMSMDRSMAIGHSVANDILRELGRVTELHKNRPEMASLAVLKSPDIPSILVETGFISNPAEEKLLRNSAHQERLAKAIHTGIMRYFEANPPGDSLLAHRNKTTSNAKGSGSSKSSGSAKASSKSNAGGKHLVQRGDSLSSIAAKYGVTMSSIRKANNLKSDNVMIGQKLVIPQG